jgi:UDP-N-acetylglucosamine--N-acetylmuramyl-(pentapeptide) pyrophosphoryl-undecaprenol N-acetylglucosamine transferase
MESQLVPNYGFDFTSIEFSGVRGKGLFTLLALPLRLIKACWQSLSVIRKLRPDVLIAMGGYITVPPSLVGACALGKPLVLHEQNSVAGSANRLLAKFAKKAFSAFPGVLGAEWVGNPLRDEFKNEPHPERRLGQRVGPLKVLVVGGSLGARVLNTVVPEALALIPAEQRPLVKHQGGAKQFEELKQAYAKAGIAHSSRVELVPFIEDMASAYLDADVVICRAGASTVSELSALGVAAVYVPFAHAVDDHQTINAKFMTNAGAGWLMSQAELNPAGLAKILMQMERAQILDKASKAYGLRKIQATELVVQACEEIVK